MKSPAFFKRAPRLLKWVILVGILSAGFKLTLAYADSGYTVSGQASFNGSPAPLQSGGQGMQVAFGASDGPSGQTNTDSNGNYSVGSLPNDSYYTSIYYQNSSEDSGTTGVPNFFQLGSANPSVNVNGSNVTQNLSFSTNTVTVTVKDGSGNPVSGSTVTVTPTGNNTVTTTDGSETFNVNSEQEQSTGITGDDGANTVSVFAGVTYKVCADTTSGGQYCASANVTVNGNTTAEVDFPLSYTVSGQASFNGNSASNMQVAFGASDGPSGQTNTDSNGNYSVGSLPNDSYSTNLFYQSTGTTGAPTFFQIASTTPSVAVNGSNVTQNLAFNTNTVTVTVKDGNGNPVPGSQVVVTASGNNTVTTTDGSETFTVNSGQEQSTGSSGDDGIVSVNVFPGITYKVCADTTSGGQYCTPTNVTVNSNTTAEVDFPSSYTVSGQASFNGNPPPLEPGGTGMQIALGASDGPSGQTNADSNGNYSVGSLPNDNYYTNLYYQNTSEDSGTTGTPNFFQIGSASPSVTVNGGDTEQNLSFNTDTVNVTVKDGNGNPVSGAPVTITATGNNTVTTTDESETFNVNDGQEQSIGSTDTNGTDTLSVFAGVTYKICADTSSGGQYCTPTNVTVNSNTTAEVDLPSISSAPTITSAASANVGMRTPFDFSVTTTGNPAPSITENGALPAGITFTDNGNGTADLAGTAATGSAGAYPITITATNGVGSPATQSFILTVTSAGSAPAITSNASDTETFGVPFSFTVNTTGYPAPKLTKAGGLPSGVTFTDNGDGTAAITGTPSASAVGVYALTIKAKSSVGMITQSFTLTVTRAPVIKNIPNKTATVGTAFFMTVTASGYMTPALTESGTMPNGLTFVDNGDGTATITGTPATGSGGSYSITVTAANSLGSISQTFTLKVNETPAITSAATTSATVGSVFSFQVMATGFPSPSITKTGTLPRGVTFNGTTNTFSGTPKAGTAGTYPITITAKNSSGTITQNFVLTVS